MVLWFESNASYLSCTKSRSRASGYFYLSDCMDDNNTPPDLVTDMPASNGPVHVLCKIMGEMVSSATEAELGALFYNGREAAPMRTTLAESLGFNTLGSPKLQVEWWP